MSVKIQIIVTIFLLLFSCKKENQPPVIQSITESPSIIKTGETTQLTCVATDADGDQLTYFWSSANGTFPSGTTGADVSWKAPGEVGEFSITLEVNDGKHITDGSVNIIVENQVNVTFIDSRDNKTYRTVKIGNQIWMAENLAYLPEVSPSSEGSETFPHYYVYGYEGIDVEESKLHVNYTTYGVLYNWPAAMNGASSSNTKPSQVQGICPAGWHLPSDDEWMHMIIYLIVYGNNYDRTTTGNKIAKSLAATTYWNLSWHVGAIGNNLSVNNNSGFSALPGGYRYGHPGEFNDVVKSGTWWSCTELWVNSSTAFGYLLNSHSATSERMAFYTSGGLSVRCVKD
jgi:uncharacterized protein (TIGR02145 family)